MKRIPHISALMQAFPRHLDGDTPLAEARHFMHTHQLSCLPVLNSAHQVLGVVTLAELANATDTDLASLVRPAPTVDASERADRVLLLLAESEHQQVVVLRQGRLAGLFSRADACRAFADFLRAPFAPSGGDDIA